MGYKLLGALLPLLPGVGPRNSVISGPSLRFTKKTAEYARTSKGRRCDLAVLFSLVYYNISLLLESYKYSLRLGIEPLQYPNSVSSMFYKKMFLSHNCRSARLSWIPVKEKVDPSCAEIVWYL
jgi:hypothetical protein